MEESEINPSPTTLAEEPDSYVNGQLMFQSSTDKMCDDDNTSEGSNGAVEKRPVENSKLAENVSKKKGQKVLFEIITAKEVSSEKKKYINYTILIKRSPGLEQHPGIAERRYSEFLMLYQSLAKKYPSFLDNFPFPKKMLLGNFSPEVISERSASFQRFTTHLFSIRELRTSTEFRDFLYGRELEEAHRILKLAQFEDAAALLENVYFIEEKVLEKDNYETFYTLCMLVACLNAVNNSADAFKYAELALPYTYKHETSKLTLPLLLLSSRLWWTAGKDKRSLEARIHELTASQGSKHSTLLELVLQKKSPLRPFKMPETFN